MKNVYLKNSALKKAKNSVFGLNLYAWLYKRLKYYSVIKSNNKCCTTKENVRLYSGVYLFSNHKSEGYFDMEKWLKKMIIELELLDPAELLNLDSLCCPTDKTLKIFKEFVYFGKNNTKIMSLKNILKTVLDDYGITYTDSCC